MIVFDWKWLGLLTFSCGLSQFREKPKVNPLIRYSLFLLSYPESSSAKTSTFIGMGWFVSERLSLLLAQEVWMGETGSALKTLVLVGTWWFCTFFTRGMICEAETGWNRGCGAVAVADFFLIAKAFGWTALIWFWPWGAGWGERCLRVLLTHDKIVDGLINWWPWRWWPSGCTVTAVHFIIWSPVQTMFGNGLDFMHVG